MSILGRCGDKPVSREEAFAVFSRKLINILSASDLHRRFKSNKMQDTNNDSNGKNIFIKSTLWETFDVDDDFLSNEFELIDEAVNDNDFLLMDIEVKTDEPLSSSPNDDNWALSEEIEEFYHDSKRFKSDSGKSLRREWQTVNDGKLPAQVVTPRQRPTSTVVLVPKIAELEIQYNRSLIRFTKSMQRSDQTRSIVKRQRSSAVSTRTETHDHDNDDASDDFFVSARCKELEETRRQVYKMLNTGRLGDSSRNPTFVY